MTDNNYHKQAEDFLDKTGTTFEAKFLYNGPYFPDDKENRNVYEIKLSRSRLGRSYTFRFGQSIARSGSGKREIPTAYDVLACITKFDPGTFKDFCANFCYDEDSRKAFDIYLKVQDEWDNINRLFGDVLDELQEIN